MAAWLLDVAPALCDNTAATLREGSCMARCSVNPRPLASFDCRVGSGAESSSHCDACHLSIQLLLVESLTCTVVGDAHTLCLTMPPLLLLQAWAPCTSHQRLRTLIRTGACC